MFGRHQCEIYIIDKLVDLVSLYGDNLNPNYCVFYELWDIGKSIFKPEPLYNQAHMLWWTAQDMQNLDFNMCKPILITSLGPRWLSDLCALEYSLKFHIHGTIRQ